MDLGSLHSQDNGLARARQTTNPCRATDIYQCNAPLILVKVRNLGFQLR